VAAGYYAHASAGCLHIRPVMSLKTPGGVAQMKVMSEAVLEVVIAMGGAMSGEHGDGLSRSMWNGRLFGPEVYEAFCELKRLFDPHGRLNPGKVVEAPDLTRNLRYGAHASSIQLDSPLSFAFEGGFAAAVEQCNGMGVCRKSEGTMCPSYMATREEEHSTRGRANALRAALSGRLPPAALTSRRMHDVLDLCLECKACKTECPSGVDMAKIKYAFLSQYQAANGVPLRARLFAQIHRLSQLACRLAPVTNLALSLRPVRWLNEKLLGIARHQRLPEFASQPFRRWYANTGRPPVSNRHSPLSNPVVLFVDTFTNFNHPEIGAAAVRLLEAAGCQVLLVDHGCCGRPMISKGMLDQARQVAARNVAALGPYAERGIPIVGLEPSCLLTLVDEYRDLLPGQPYVDRVARRAMMIETFLSDLERSGRLPLRWRDAPKEVQVHGHCYQKALTGTGHLVHMLRLPGWQVTEINAGCCGMAGSFGYEAEHYEISQRIGEDRLFPAVRAAEDQVAIVASGMSCRHQIQHGTGRRAYHPVELLAEAIQSDKNVSVL
jgi:Fe-S oxidoreductase